MEKINDGGPAFPREDYQTDYAGGQRGMTLRDYFAAKAMAAMLSHNEKLCIRLANEPEHVDAVPRSTACCVAEGAYEMADAMLKAREAR